MTCTSALNLRFMISVTHRLLRILPIIVPRTNQLGTARQFWDSNVCIGIQTTQLGIFGNICSSLMMLGMLLRRLLERRDLRASWQRSCRFSSRFINMIVLSGGSGCACTILEMLLPFAEIVQTELRRCAQVGKKLH